MDLNIVLARVDPAYRDDFCNFQQRYGNRLYMKGFLPPSVWEQFFELAPDSLAEFWLAYEGKRPVGRVGASLMPSYQGLGSVGFFELDLNYGPYGEVSKALLKQATNWLKKKSCSKVVGPMNLNTWFPYRFRSDQDITKRFSWEPVHPPEYLQECLHFGVVLDTKYKAFNTGQLSDFVEKTKTAYGHCLNQEYHFRNFDSECFLERDIPILYEMSMECFKGNYLFEPISLEAFRALYVPIVDKMDHTLGKICFAKDGSPAGFGFSFVDDGVFVIKTLATMPLHRGHGISNALAYLAGSAAYKRGLHSYITAIIHAGAQSESYGKKGTIIWEHNYDLLAFGLKKSE